MITAHEKFAAIQRDAATTFAQTALASSHGAITRRVRRDRTVRASATALAGVGLVGAGTFGALQLRGADALAPMGTPSPSTSGTDNSAPRPSFSAEPSPEPSGLVEIETYSVDVYPGDHADVVIQRLAEAYDVPEGEARDALVGALPAEADGDPEGWLGEGVWLTHMQSLEEAADDIVARKIADLEFWSIPREQWRETLVMASVVQAEGGTAAEYDDLRGITTVIRNRLEDGTKLEIESPLRYYAETNDLDPSDDGWIIDTPYNLYLYQGLPPTPIGSPDRDAIGAVLEPLAEDWRYFVTAESDGRVLFASTFEGHQQNLVEVGQLDPGDVG